MKRARLRVFAGIWLLLQIASLAAFVPPDCCAKHRTSQPPPCHETTAAARDDAGDCRLSSTCDGPMAALFTLLSQYGPLPDGIAPHPSRDTRSALPLLDEATLARIDPPDPQPPRS